jgi:hypothetical protein
LLTRLNEASRRYFIRAQRTRPAQPVYFRCTPTV